MTDLKNIIKNNDVIVNEINQNLHNKGVNFSKRINIIINLMEYKFLDKPFKNEDIDKKLEEELLKLIKNISISKEELCQKIFMFYGKEYVKTDLDQYYTPITIGQFICNLCIPKKRIIDPAAGTGDLAISYDGEIHLWDISKDVIELTELNCKFQNKKAEIKQINSLEKHSDNNNSFDYVTLNPPFGSKTIINDKNILTNYKIGINEKKQEVGMLFIERSINLLNNNGVAFIIIPNGYLGNTTSQCIKLRQYLLEYNILGVIQLPSGTFSRSGTGVSTSMIIVSKNTDIICDEIFVYDLKEIGYILNKKNTPYNYLKDGDDYILDDNNLPIILTDYKDCSDKFYNFIIKNKIQNINVPNDFVFNSEIKYECINRQELDNNCILDIKRYLKIYRNVISKYSDKKKLIDYINKSNYSFKKQSDKEYLYLDIKQVNTPFYDNTNFMLGNKLPDRAKIKLNMNDIIVSSLKVK